MCPSEFAFGCIVPFEVEVPVAELVHETCTSMRRAIRVGSVNQIDVVHRQLTSFEFNVDRCCRMNLRSMRQ